MTRRNFWINQAFFQASWPACVIGAGQGLIWPAILVVGSFALWQLAPARRHPRDLTTVTSFVLAGLLLDTLWPRLGIVEYATVVPFEGFAPIWLVMLWLALGLTVNHSLAAFRHRWRILALVATFASPLSYAAAAGFGAVAWVAPVWLVLICLGPVWALVVALLFRQAATGAAGTDLAPKQPSPQQSGVW
ncbi:MAG: DUF2878 domain-containing protein [Wenzhouxiangella sp.]